MERLTSKPPLITPSASPPSSLTFLPRPHRIPDQASPAKRPRLSSAPRQFQPHVSTPLSTTNLDQVDFQKAREASAMRMLDVWAHLAERYSRPLDEDDIIDLNTGKVVKDRGVIRGSERWDLGCFADAVGEEAEEGDDEEDEDEIDELDSFTHQQTIGRQPMVEEVGVRNVPPVREMDPADAEDLRQFLEAEKRRRETCGSEVEETESSAAETCDEAYDEEERLADSVNNENTDDSVHESTTSLVNNDTTLPNTEANQTPVPRSASPFVDSGSDDELLSYGIDETSAVYRVSKEEIQESDSDSEVEFVEYPLPPRPKQKPGSIDRQLENRASQPAEHSRIRPTQQLQTPPLSQTSSLISSVTPSDDYYIELPPDSSSPLPSSPLSSHYSSPIKTPQHKYKNPSESRKSPTSLQRNVLSTPIPRLDLTKLSRGKPVIKSKISKNTLRPSHTRLGAEMLESRNSLAVNSDSPVSKGPLIRSKVEVVIEKRAFRQSSHSSPTRHPEAVMIEKDSRHVRSVEDIRPLGKGKKKAEQPNSDLTLSSYRAPVDTAQSDDSIIVISSSPSPVSKKAVPASPKTKQPATNLPIDVPRRRKQSHERSHVNDKPTSAPTSKKRKRVVSSEVKVAGRNETTEPLINLETRVGESATILHSTQFNTPSSTENELGGVEDFQTKRKHKRNPTPKQRSRSSSRPRQSDYDSDSSSRSSPERFPAHGHRYNRAHSQFSSIPPPESMYYTYPQPPYPPQIYAPIPDPRAQFIITQAMHQLSALVGGQWTPSGSHHHNPTPFTPSSHNRHQYRGSSSAYSTPTHHQHPYPYSYDSNLSRGTLPPDSPEVQSSPAIAAGRKSLVKRSRSRGRRVSFMIEEESVDAVDVPPDLTRHDENDRSEGTSNGNPAGRKNETKGVATEVFGENYSLDHGRASARAQTPGPSICDLSEQGSDKPIAKLPVKARGRSQSRPTQTR